MDPPKSRKKREATLKKRDKGHVYSAKHARLQEVSKKCSSISKPLGR